MKKNLQTETWSSHLAFYLSIAGAAIGLGTLWRFPFLVGQYGGGLFVLVFAVVCVFIATPLLIAEFMIGRRGGMNVPLAPARVALAAGRSRNWAAIGWLGTLAIFLIMTYYSVIGGWVLAYIKAFALDGAASLDRAALAARFDALLANPWRLTFWHAAFMAATIAISAPGLHRGIELGNKVMLPGLFLILFGLGLYALVQGDASHGLAYLTHVDFGDLSAELVLAAVGQAFYATGVGMAIMIAYGSHVASDESLPRSAAVVVGSIVLASLLASFLIFPLAFAYGEDPAQGPQLAFIVLPSMFVGMPGAPVVGTCFFLLLAFASLSSSIAGLEPGAGWLMERYGMGRASAVTLVGASAWVLGLGTVWSFNLWKDVHPLGMFRHFHEHTLFALVDYFSANLLLPIGALLTCIFVGWRLHSTPVDAEFGKDRRLRGVLLLLLRYLCPLAILGVLITAL